MSVFYKFTACTSTLKSINLPHSSCLISKANHFAFELCLSTLVLHCICIVFCVLGLCCVIVASHHCLLRRLSVISLLTHSFSNLLLNLLRPFSGHLSKACVEFVLLELRIQTAKRIVFALETLRTFFACSYSYPLQRIGS